MGRQCCPDVRLPGAHAVLQSRRAAVTGAVAGMRRRPGPARVPMRRLARQAGRGGDGADRAMAPGVTARIGVRPQFPAAFPGISGATPGRSPEMPENRRKDVRGARGRGLGRAGGGVRDRSGNRRSRATDTPGVRAVMACFGGPGAFRRGAAAGCRAPGAAVVSPVRLLPCPVARVAGRGGGPVAAASTCRARGLGADHPCRRVSGQGARRGAVLWHVPCASLPWLGSCLPGPAGVCSGLPS